MKIKLSYRFAPILPVSLFFFSALAAGCGGGGNPYPSASPTPIATPTPPPSSFASTSPTGVTTRGSYQPGPANTHQLSGVTVTFPAYAVELSRLREYHVYRNGLLAGRIQHSEDDTEAPATTYTDAGNTPPTAYQRVNASDATKLEPAQSIGVGPFAFGTSVNYTITVLYRTEGGTFAETEIGRSNVFEPYQ